MIDEELSFYVDKNGMKTKCDIIAMISGENENETYVAFVDYLEGNNNGFQYAKIIKNDDTYSIYEFEDENIVEALKEKISDNIKENVFKSLEENNE